MRRLISVLPFCLLLLASRSAIAQERAPGFTLNRFDPSERGSDWFLAESLDLRGHGRLAIGLVADWAHKPLVVYDNASGDELSPLVQNQVVGHLGGSVNLWNRLRVAASFPISLYQNGDGLTASGTEFAADTGTHSGDLRLGLDARLFGEYRSPMTLALGAQLHVPTGSRSAFTSDGTVRFSPRLLAAGEAGRLVYAGRLQFNLRPEDAGFAGVATGHELFTALAVGARVAEHVVLGPELVGSTVVSEAGAAFSRRTTPLELLFGGHLQAGDLRLGLAVGPGLTRGYGAPVVRVLGSVEYFPSADRDHDGVADNQDACPDNPGVATNDPRSNGCPRPQDRDEDGILDVQDACPSEPGMRTDDPKTNGCPPPKDSDRDGIFDVNDACPEVAGIATDDPKTNGCPPPKDNDRDGILDVEDACPEEYGVRTDDPKSNGCPPPKDRDRDGIFDETDACPEQPGPPTNDPKTNGCPLARIEKGEIKIVEQVKFGYNNARIMPESEPIMNAVLRIFQENADVQHVEVHGHTDNKGSDIYNQRLSQRRAEAVAQWLTVHGIAKERVSAQGFGESKPLDTNDTEDGRRNNRRVEFHIIKRAAK